MRSFADFAALAHRQRLGDHALMPMIWKSAWQMPAFTISRPVGLSLTPPQMPVAQTPSALARFGDGPSYLDFADWGQAGGGSFLATERKLTQIRGPRRSAEAGHGAADPGALLSGQWLCRRERWA